MYVGRRPASRHSQPSPWGGPTGGGTASTPLRLQARQPPPAHSSPNNRRLALCRPPARPCPLFNPAWWFRPPPTIQRRNHDPRPPPCSPPKHHLARPKRQQSRKQYSSLHGVAWAANPASSPAPPPTQVVDTTAHHVPLKLAQLAPPTPLTGRTSNKRDTLFSSEGSGRCSGKRAGIYCKIGVFIYL